jgi:anthranilate synthase component 1
MTGVGKRMNKGVVVISFSEFERLAQVYNVIPLLSSTLADLHTPVTAYLAMREKDRPSFLFESVEPDEKIGRFSFVGADPILLIRGRNGEVEYVDQTGSTKRRESIFDALQAILSRYRQAPVPAFQGMLGGLVGYLGYPAVGSIEKIALHPTGEADEDDAMFGLFTTLLQFDHRRQQVILVHNVVVDPSRHLRDLYENGRKILEALELRLRRSVHGSQSFICSTEGALSGEDAESYGASVRRAKAYIVEGDIFQVVLSRRVRLPYDGDLFPVYRALRMINPSPYLFFMDFGQTQFAGSSPEVLVRVIDRRVEVLPIAGTRPRGKTSEEDRRMEQELLADEKELAEHVMLVDLGRNDVGRIAEFGTVHVPVLKRIERYSHVMHIVSEVHGTLRPEYTPLQALKACFPAGTVSGAPKVRAMEIINELEPRSRGAYAGAVGYVGLNGNLDTCIAIRTVIAHRKHLSIQVGAGIVADSTPEGEYRETVNKSRALIEAIRIAAGGLRELGADMKGNGAH